MLVFAIDDEPKMLRMLHGAIAQAQPEAEIMDFGGGSPVLKALQEQGLRPDVVFSDIELPGMDGISLAVQIKRAAPACRIVFVTGYDSYALEAFHVHAQGYLMKPVTAAAVREELDQIPLAPARREKGLFVQCFGQFEVYYEGKPLLFERRKTKELFAFLVDRRGASCTAEEIVSVLWEEDSDLRGAKHRLRNLVMDLRTQLKGLGMEELLVRKSGVLALQAEQLDCDYYRLLQGDPQAVNAYGGEYMSQYSWAEATAGKLWFSRRI